MTRGITPIEKSEKKSVEEAIKNKWKEKNKTNNNRIKEIIVFASRNQDKYALVIDKNENSLALYHIWMISYLYDKEGDDELKKVEFIGTVGQNNFLGVGFPNLKKAIGRAIDIKWEKQYALNLGIAQTNIRNILLIGKTGGGKSALGNTLLNRGGEFEMVFVEGSGSASKTKFVQSEEFNSEGIVYRVIDTIGVYDTKLTPKEVWGEIVKESRIIEGGINQIVFVVGKRFTDDVVNAYRLLVTIFGQEVTKHIIIVRSHFSKFFDGEKCFEDYQAVIRENEGIKEMITSASWFIHVDNPPMEEGEKIKEIREKSREKLLVKLSKKGDIYEEPESLVKLGKKIIKNVIRESKAIESLKEQKEEEIRKIYKEIKENSNKKYSQKIEEYVKERIVEQQKLHNDQEWGYPINNQQNISAGVGLLGVFFGNMIKGIIG